MCNMLFWDVYQFYFEYYCSGKGFIGCHHYISARLANGWQFMTGPLVDYAFSILGMLWHSGRVTNTEEGDNYSGM